MMKLNLAANLRKAAVLIRSLDTETAANLLAQLSDDEAAAIRAGMQSLGTIDPEEQADVAAELRRVRPVAAEMPHQGVELDFSSTAAVVDTYDERLKHSSTKRFAFLDDAPIETLATCLVREHAQTIAVVVSHLVPTSAVAVLAALPARLQADTLERLAALGDTDPESLAVVERELSAWVARQPAGRRRFARSSQAIEGILSAADTATRGRILANLLHYNERLAVQLVPKWSDSPLTSARAITAPGLVAKVDRHPPAKESPIVTKMCAANPPSDNVHRRQKPRDSAASLFEFGDLARLSTSELAEVLRDVDATVLVLALAGSSDQLVHQVTKQMPKRMAKSFRAKLRKLGPTRLSDVEAAQHAVAAAAARRFGKRRPVELSAS